MDWYVDGANPAEVSGLRRDFGEYVRRHAAPDQDVAGAELAFSELVTNAAQHAGGPIWVSVDWNAPTPLVTVYDLGPGFDLKAVPDSSAAGGRGLAIAASLASQLSVHARTGGGSRTEARLDVLRGEPVSHDPPRSAIGILPALEEAGPRGFEKESFLRALVVQLAQETERLEGPAAAERLIAQVGIDVGGQMEAEYRSASGIGEGPLSAEQMAECFVRLKHAIDGDFYPISITDDEIVLANRCCPFGDPVKQAPALCRMTSSVFGGIAARTKGAATVFLEERIAVGDHQCKVIIKLGDTGDDYGHHYRGPA